MADTTVRPVHMLRVHAIELAHAGRQIRLRRFNHHVVVIRHLAPRVNAPIEALAHLRQRLQPGAPIPVDEKNIFAAVAARCHVVEAAGKFDP